MKAAAYVLQNRKGEMFLDEKKSRNIPLFTGWSTIAKTAVNSNKSKQN